MYPPVCTPAWKNSAPNESRRNERDSEASVVTPCRNQWRGWATAPAGNIFPGMPCKPLFPGAALIAWLDLSHRRVCGLEGQEAKQWQVLS